MSDSGRTPPENWFKGSAASHPGRIFVQWPVHLRHYPTKPLLYVLGMVASVALAWLVSWWFLAALPVVLFFIWRYVSMLPARAYYGCLNPAVVICEQPFLLAVYTDLTTGYEPHPVIKICRSPRPKGDYPVGTRMPTVSMYYGDFSSPSLDNFIPVLVACYTSNRRDINDAEMRLEREYWDGLEEVLAEVPRPYRPGLYNVSMCIGPADGQHVVAREGQPDVVMVPDDDETMKRAMEQARATVGQFLDALANPQPGCEAFAVKAQIRDGDESEFLWINRLRFDGTHIYGQVNNEPLIVTKAKLGQKVRLKPSRVCDWIYAENGEMVGGFTTRVLTDDFPA